MCTMEYSHLKRSWIGVYGILAVLSVTQVCAAPDPHASFGTSQSQISLIRAASGASDWQDAGLDSENVEQNGDFPSTEPPHSGDSTNPLLAEFSTERIPVERPEVTTRSPMSLHPASKLPDIPEDLPLHPSFSGEVESTRSSNFGSQGNTGKILDSDSDVTFGTETPEFNVPSAEGIESASQQCTGEFCEQGEFPEGVENDQLYFVVESFEDFMMSSMRPHKDSPRLVIGLFSREKLDSEDFEIEVVETPEDEQLVPDGAIESEETTEAYVNGDGYVENSIENGESDQTVDSILSNPPSANDKDSLVKSISDASSEQNEQFLLINPSADKISEAISLTETETFGSAREKRSVQENIRVTSHSPRTIRRTIRRPPHRLNNHFVPAHGRVFRRPVVVYRPVRTYVTDRHGRYNLRVRPRRVARRRIIKKRTVSRI